MIEADTYWHDNHKKLTQVKLSSWKKRWKRTFLRLDSHMKTTSHMSVTMASPPPSLRQRALQDTTLLPPPDPKRANFLSFPLLADGRYQTSGGSGGTDTPASCPSNPPCSNFCSTALMRVPLRQLFNEELIWTTCWETLARLEAYGAVVSRTNVASTTWSWAAGVTPAQYPGFLLEVCLLPTPSLAQPASHQMRWHLP